MQVGDLVGYEDGDIGIIIMIGKGEQPDHCYIQWSDGCNGWHLLSELEVINEV